MNSNCKIKQGSSIKRNNVRSGLEKTYWTNGISNKRFREKGFTVQKKEMLNKPAALNNNCKDNLLLLFYYLLVHV
jgi:hypothetical protein